MFRKDPLQKRDSFVYGVHPVIEALESGKTIDKVWIQEGVLQGQLKDILMMLRDRNIIWKQVPIQKLNTLVRGNHQADRWVSLVHLLHERPWRQDNRHPHLGLQPVPRKCRLRHGRSVCRLVLEPN